MGCTVCRVCGCMEYTLCRVESSIGTLNGGLVSQLDVLVVWFESVLNTLFLG